MFLPRTMAVVVVLSCAAGAIGMPAASAQDDAVAAEIRANVAKLVKEFNAGKAADVSAHFLPNGELIDEEGNVYQGREEIQQLFTTYFGKFPGAKLAVEVESVRLVGPVAIEEGSRTMSTKDEANKAQMRYVAVHSKTNTGWQIASLRDFADDPPPTPNEMLQPLAWLVGDWMNEGSDTVVKISVRWSEDKNFLLSDFLININDKPAMKTSQRIGWDPLTSKIRSWTFDSDGGYADALWTQVGDEWVIKSNAVLPDGQTGSATVTLIPKEKDRYTMKGTERVVGNEREKDYEIVIAKQPPKAQK